MGEFRADAIAVEHFLSVRSSRSGDIKGESVATGHADEIVISGWHWGMASASDGAVRSTGQGGAPARRSLRTLVVNKTFDRASTSLMASLANNDKLKSVVLSMRKAGNQKDDFASITLTDAWILDIDIAADASGKVVERVSFSFGSMDVEYRAQSGAGMLGGASTFHVEA